MKKQYSELLKNTGVLAIANFSSKILVFLLVPLYTSFLTTDEFGLTDLIFSTVQLVVPIFTLNVADAVLRFCLESDTDSDAVLSISVRYTLYSLLPMAMLLVITIVMGLYDVNRINWPYTVLYYFAFALNQCLPTYAKGIDRIKETAISGVLSTLTTVSTSILFVVIMRRGIRGYFLSNVLGQMAPVLYLSLVLGVPQKVLGYRQRNTALEKRMLMYSIPLIATTIGWWINNTSDKYIITYFYDVSLNGLLSVAYKIPSILSILSGLFIQAWQISAMKEYGREGSGEFYRSIFVCLNSFLYCVTFALILLTKPIASVAFQKDFYEAWIFVPFLLLSMVFTANAGFFSPIITSSYNTKDVALSTVYGAILNVGLNIALLKLMGPQGVAVATAISGFFIMGYRYWVLRRLIAPRVFARIGILWMLITAQCVLELHSIWYMEPLLAVVAVAIFRREIVGIFGIVCNLIKRRGTQHE